MLLSCPGLEPAVLSPPGRTLEWRGVLLPACLSVCLHTRTAEGLWGLGGL